MVWGILMEMKRFCGKVKEEDQGAVALVPDLAKGLRACQPPCGLGLGDASQFPKKDLAVLCVFRAPEEGTVRRMCGRAVTDHHGHPAGVQVELSASADCIAGCID